MIDSVPFGDAQQQATSSRYITTITLLNYDIKEYMYFFFVII